LLEESNAFIESGTSALATAFPGWVPIDPMTRQGTRRIGKLRLLVCSPFSVVMLEDEFLSPILSALGISPSTRDFHRQLHQRGSRASSPCVCVRWFGWWLLSEKD